MGCRYLRILIREGCHYVLRGMEILFLLPRRSSQGLTGDCSGLFGIVRACSGLFGDFRGLTEDLTLMSKNLFRVISRLFNGTNDFWEKVLNWDDEFKKGERR